MPPPTALPSVWDCSAAGSGGWHLLTPKDPSSGWALTLTSVLGVLSPRGRSRWGAWRGRLRGGRVGASMGETRLGTHNPESSWAAALLTKRLNGPEDPAALAGQDGDDRFPGIFPASGSEPSALPAGPHSTLPPNCSWVAGHVSSTQLQRGG